MLWCLSAAREIQSRLSNSGSAPSFHRKTWTEHPLCRWPSDVYKTFSTSRKKRPIRNVSEHTECGSEAANFPAAQRNVSLESEAISTESWCATRSRNVICDKICVLRGFFPSLQVLHEMWPCFRSSSLLPAEQSVASTYPSFGEQL